MKRIIVTRFSAMGDVAMVASVLQEFQIQHKDTEIIMVSRKLFQGFFEHIPRIQFHIFEPESKHKGLSGIYRLYNELKKYHAHFVADLHNNIRSRILNTLFRISSYQVAVLYKGRIEKIALTRRKNKILRPLKPTTERYAEVFRKLGFDINLSHTLQKIDRPIPIKYASSVQTASKKIGIAPFAQHPYKVFPLDKMEQVVTYLSEKDYTVFLFGGGSAEKKQADLWSSKYSHVINTIGSLTITQELDLIANLDIMVSMDSSGMHMASLVGTRCISIWGATHPFVGFLGYGQSYDDCAQVNHPNRPSSVFGNKPCDCDGIEAIDLVTAEMVINKIEKIFQP